jgi:hypothetical protein
VASGITTIGQIQDSMGRDTGAFFLFLLLGKQKKKKRTAKNFLPKNKKRGAGNPAPLSHTLFSGN